MLHQYAAHSFLGHLRTPSNTSSQYTGGCCSVLEVVLSCCWRLGRFLRQLSPPARGRLCTFSLPPPIAARSQRGGTVLYRGRELEKCASAALWGPAQPAPRLSEPGTADLSRYSLPIAL